MKSVHEVQAETDLRKLADLRAELEAFAAREAAGRPGCGAEARRTLQPILARLREAAGSRDHDAFREADRLLHERIVLLAEVPTLRAIWGTVWEALAAFHRESLKVYWPDLRVLMDEHEYLVDAICAGDAAAAQDGVRSHLKAVWFRIAERRGDILREQDPLQRATAYLAFHLHRRIRLPQVAREIAFTSAGHLSKLFREHHGKSFRAYLQDLRMEVAADLLARTTLPVAQIARRVGYGDASRFGQHFKRTHRTTPGDWRRRHGTAGTPDR